ncbi:hypothetical protein GQ600_24256 [Phytophthora cactorum]|nr:hypothetical protein GQ600_24256 [Phytophthora cactorum]
MQNDHNVLHSAKNLLMNLRLSRSYSEDDVEAALAEAAAIRQATEENVQSEDAAQWCQNPFCRSVLYTFYASYCERAMCQLHRGLKLQCQANAEAAALQEMRSNRRSNSFLVLRTSSSVEATQGLRAGIAEDESKEKETCDPDAPFVIPRRKRPSATMNKAHLVR